MVPDMARGEPDPGGQAGAAEDKTGNKGWRTVCSERRRRSSDLTLNGGPSPG